MGKQVIFCNCLGKIIDPSRLVEIEKLLLTSGIIFSRLTDLCGICATRKDEANRIFSIQEETLVIACYPRAIKLLLNHSGVNLKTNQLSVINFRGLSNDEIKNQVHSFLSGESIITSSSEIECDKEWPAWYPVIDYSRCTSCGQCADFCLFGVYDKSDGVVKVLNPKECKNNCPACARICPQTAIVFPRYELGGAIAGSDSIDEMAEQQRQLQDVDSILGSDIYKALELRKTKRQSIISNEAMNKALEEREKAMQEKQEL